MAIELTHAGMPTGAATRPRDARAALSRLTIRRKILLAFLCMGGLTGGLGAYVVTSIAAIGQLTERTFDGALMSIGYARAAAADFAGIEAAMARLASRTTPQSTADAQAKIRELSQSLTDDLGIATERALSPQAMQAAAAAIEAFAAWQAMSPTFTGSAGDTASDILDAAAQAVNDRLELLVNHAAGDGFRLRQRARAKVIEAKSLALFGTAVAMVLGSAIAILLARRIMGPVAVTSAAAGRIAAGELDTHIPMTGTDEMGALLSAMAVMRDNIAAMVAREVKERRSAQACLTGAIEGSGEGVMVIDAHGTVAVANTRMGEYFPALCGAAHASFAALADSVPALRLLAEDAAGEICLISGTWLRINRSRTRDGGFVTICSDITALKQHEAKLEQANTRLDAAMDNMAQGLCMFDSGKQLRLINRRLCEMFGLCLSCRRLERHCTT